MKILNFGSCNIDDVYSVDHIVRVGETIQTHSLQQFPGGKGLNQSVSLARAGVRVYHAGCIGKDGSMLRTQMQQSGIDLQYLRTVEEKTGHAIIQVSEEGDNSIFLYRGANYAVTKEQIDMVLADFGQGDYLLMQNEISNLPYLVDRAYERGMVLFLNPSPFDETVQQIDLNKISYLILNEVEAAGYVDSDDRAAFLNIMKKRYPALNILLTLGKNGSIYREGDKIFRCPAFAVKTVDTTAAGDTFTGYFVALLSKGYAPEQILQLASAAAALTVSRQGAASSIPEYCETSKAVETLRPHTDQLSEQKKQMLDYLEQHLAEASIEGLATALSYSPRYTGKWVKEHTGKSFLELLQKMRVEKAAEYLRSTELSVREITLLVGYHNESFFRKIFQQRYQMNPLEYRRANK